MRDITADSEGGNLGKNYFVRNITESNFNSLTYIFLCYRQTLKEILTACSVLVNGNKE